MHLYEEEHEMKRYLALFLACLLLISAMPVALAADNPMGDQLAAVTQKVKTQLGIGDDFTSFQGEPRSGENETLWQLSWEKDEGISIEVTATDSGKIISYRYEGVQDARYDSSFSPAFPKTSDADILQAAETFLKKVLTDGETAQLTAKNIYRQNDEIMLSFPLNLQGLPAPFHASLNLSQGQVVSYWRSSGSLPAQPQVPSSKAAITADAAGKTLAASMKLRLEYTTDPARTGKNATTATLHYVPVDQDNRVVDAQTGALLNLSELQRNLYAKEQSAADGGSGKENALSPSEQAGIEKLQGILSRQALEQKLRAMPELGLGQFNLEQAQYSYLSQEDRYQCTLIFSMRSGEDYKVKYATVDAKTGALSSLFSTGSDRGDLLATEASAGKAQAFLSKYFPSQATQVKAYPQAGQQQGVTMAQQVNDIFHPGNAYRMTFDTKTGWLDSFSANWKDVTFEKPEGLVTLQAAQDAWYAAQPATLQYVAQPTESKTARGNNDKLVLAYANADQSPAPYAVDAKTGQVLRSSSLDEEAIAYSDVTNDTAILALAQAGIGYKGGTFEKGKTLTQVDMLAFLVSADGWYYDAQEEGALDSLYNRAYRLGMLQRNQRQPDAVVTRGQLVKTILDMSGYGKAAQLKNLFTCTFSDAAAIAPELFGYAAIAQSMGMVRGDELGRFNAAQPANRMQMATMLYNFMNR